MRTIVITGGTGDLGSVVVPRLAREHRCVVIYRSEPPKGIEGVRADLSNEDDARRAFDEIGEHFALVHLAGGFELNGIRETTKEQWQRMLETNATAAMIAARESLRHMSEGGRIIAISSILSIEPAKGMLAYLVSKAALNALIQTLAVETRSRRITANAILPAGMATPAMLETTDASKLVPPQQVAETIAFLLSDDAAGITGTLIPIRA